MSNEDMRMNEEPVEECLKCKMDKTMMGITMAHLSCSAIKEEGERGECMAWAADLDPSQIKDVENILLDAYDRSGIQGLAVMPKLYEQLVRTVVVKKVGDKMQRGLPVTEDEMKVYTEYTKNDAKQGI